MRVEPSRKLLRGLGTGVAFGTLLQKGRVAKYEVIRDQLLLRDATVAKVMGTAAVVGAVGVHALADSWFVDVAEDLRLTIVPHRGTPGLDANVRARLPRSR